VALDRDHLMAVSPNRPTSATDLLRHNYRENLRRTSGYYEDQQSSIAALADAPLHHALPCGDGRP
jgi:hypothetical protein